MILRPGQPRVPLRAAHHEAAGGIDEELGVFVQHLRGQDFADDFRDDEIPDFLVFNISGVLGGDDHIDDPNGPAIFIFDGNLGFGVGPQPGNLAGLAHAVQLPAQAMGEHDRRGH